MATHKLKPIRVQTIKSKKNFSIFIVDSKKVPIQNSIDPNLLALKLMSNLMTINKFQ